jgi:hypothetical protein
MTEKKSKYDPDTSHWDEHDDQPPEWQERTSADAEIEVKLHDQGYQTDRKWTVHISHGLHNDPTDTVAMWAEEHHNKGNYWRDPRRYEDAADFVELPRVVRERVAAVLNRDVDEITPAERTIHREDGTGLGDPREVVGQCDICGGDVERPPDYEGEIRHPACAITEEKT